MAEECGQDRLVSFRAPVSLLDAASLIAKAIGSSQSQLMREGLEARCEQLMADPDVQQRIAAHIAKLQGIQSSLPPVAI